ncbi:MAG: sugar phosphate nucleotidyltransferase, partial [Proteobacteria bacterium]|nr:sugar phosphate nucleotidyltransferase [Pseudomonadota bacterium]
MQAVILAGGFGTRLKKVVSDVPKPMAPVNGKPFLFYLLSYLRKHHFTDIVLSVGYLKEQIQQYFGDNFLGLNIKYAIEKEPLGTGGAIINSLKLINQNQPVVILNGDTFLEVDYQKLIHHHNITKTNFTIALKEMSDCGRYGLVGIN